MSGILVLVIMGVVIWLYFANNPLKHSKKFMMRRFINWFPLGMSYAFLYMARYNLTVSKNALGSLMDVQSFGIIFGAGTTTYGLSFLLNGPLVDKFGGRKGMLLSTLGASLANVLMGLVVFLFLKGRLHWNLTITLAILYSLNMFFQSYGGVSIIKVKAYWFHVRERGLFGAIFGTLISFGVYFAFDWGQAIANATRVHIQNPTTFDKIFRALFAVDTGTTDAIWLVFFIPAVLLVFWALIDMWLIKDTPSQANHEDFDTADASSGEMDKTFSKRELLKRIFTSPVILMVAFVEFTTGVVRNGMMQWYNIFIHTVPAPGTEFFRNNWGILLCLTGIVSGFAAGLVSDKWFHSRRGPPVALGGLSMLVMAVLMYFLLNSAPITVGICAIGICMISIGIHSLMSGTAAADFGGRKATATASGITDGFVYLGTGLQSVSLGYLIPKSWSYLPAFIVPFIIIGILLAMKMWHDLPAATRRYLNSIEKIDLKKA